jgi:hypothetical protein
MLLSRFWYGVLGLGVGALVFLLSIARSVHNRADVRAVAQGLSSDTQVVEWYLRNDARMRAEQLMHFALEPAIRKGLQQSSAAEGSVPAQAREELEKALKKTSLKATVLEGGKQRPAFDAVFLVDQHGRVAAQVGYDQGGRDFELGGHPVVADGLHGFVRDDTLVLDAIYRVVARPVESDAGQMPAGAVVGARIVDDRFARELAERTGSSIVFYIDGASRSSGVYDEETLSKGALDQVVRDLPKLAEDKDYKEKGRSQIREVAGNLRVQYSRLPGEAWKLHTGYAVARKPVAVGGLFGFFHLADDKDKAEANVVTAGLIALLAIVIGLVLTVLEHSRPLAVFRREAARLAKGQTDQLQPSRFRGVYRKIASDLNDGIEAVAAKGGAPRRAADLSQVLGDLPDQPQMSAFSLPGEDAPPSLGDAPRSPGAGLPKAPPKRLPRAPGVQPVGSEPQATPPSAEPDGVAPLTAAAAVVDQAAEWRQVYEDFVATKQQCGEPLEGLTFEKFQETLRKNREALIARHGATDVRFAVHVKDGRAALKANPLRG